jgi:transposase-like protein
MPHPTLTILLVLNEIAKKKQTGPIACHWCNNQVNIIKYGTYKRYGFSGQEQIKIQRYLCKHDQCRRTFSILPHPFLRITRLTLCIITALIQLVDQQLTTAEVCRRLNLTRSMVDGAIKKWHGLLDWIDHEAKTKPDWAPSPCIDPPGHWSNFIRMFAMKFYPKRYGYA